MPFLLLSVTVLVWGLPAVKRAMDAGRPWKWEVGGLHLKIARGEALTGHSPPTEKDLEKAEADIVPVSSTGTAVFLAAVVSGFLLGLGPVSLLRMLGATVVRLIPAIATIAGMSASGFRGRRRRARTSSSAWRSRGQPVALPDLCTLLGWLGVALTGSDTSSNVLFGNLHAASRRRSSAWIRSLMASANTTGGASWAR